MRLGQLARKLGTRPSEIVDFMTSKAIASEEGTNTKLTEENIKLIVEQFAPDQLAAILSQETALPEPVIAEVVADQPTEQESVAEVPENIPKKTVPQPQPEDKTEEPSVDKIEVIKAPKVELAGLKVLGKIELPEPKKKVQAAESAEATETTATEGSSTVEKRPREDRRNRPHQKERREHKPRKNPIAAQREREAREAADKKIEQAKQEKEKKTNFYLQRVKATGPTKPARLYDEPVDELKDIQTKAQKKEPTTWLGKFWKWYRS